MGYGVFVAANDRNRIYKGKRLAELPGIVDELPVQFNDAVNRILKLIDVIWFKKSTFAAAFEIEKSTSVYSGLLRMSDLLAVAPNLALPVYIVAPDARRDKVRREVNRPTFKLTEKPLVDVCRFISFDAVKLAASTEPHTLQYLKLEWLHDSISEPCHIEDA